MQAVMKVSTTTLGLVVLLILPVIANAYTLVLRDGRRVEVPDNFIVSSSTLTYEVSSGIQITIALNAIDVAATEMVNREVTGALLRRATSQPDIKVNNSTGTSRAATTITNRDLEGYRQKRIANEQLYEQRRKELGLPSLEEVRQAALLAGERAQAQLLNLREEDQRSEAYWRNRAAELRSALADVNARINVIQERLNELPLNYSFGAFTTVAPVPVVTFGGVQSLRTSHFINAGSIGVRPGFGTSIGFGTALPVVRPLPPGQHGWGRRSFGRGGFGSLIALPFDAYDSSYERASLMSERNQLFTQRAGLQARWRELEDEARRSGAYPGWLR